ncbi:hypothetical protein [Clostridium sp. UBA5712]
MISYKVGLENIQWDKLFDLYKRVGLLKRFMENNEYHKIQSAFKIVIKLL